jgi:hypothetical protein
MLLNAINMPRAGPVRGDRFLFDPFSGLPPRAMEVGSSGAMLVHLVRDAPE